MSGGGNGFRVSAIPSNVRRMIQNIKEIGSNHSEEEIYAMLKECGMDPNETAQKLLHQDSFHEVKSKRDRKKENLNNRETAESRWRSGPPGQVGRGGQRSFSSCHPADAGEGKYPVSATENGIKQASESAGSYPPAPGAKDKKIKEAASASSVALLDNGPIHMASGDNANADEHMSRISSITSAKHTEASTVKQSLSVATENFSVASGAGITNEYVHLHPSSRKSLGSAAGTSSGNRLASDPVLVQSNDSRHPGGIGAIKHDIGSQRSCVESNTKFSAQGKLNAAYEIRRSSSRAKMGSKSHGAGKNQLVEFSRPSSSSGYGGSSSSRPSSNYGGRSQQVIGPPKGPSKEWKPKTTNSSNVLVSKTSAGSQRSSFVAKTGEQDRTVNHNVSDSEEPASKVEKELEGLHIKETQQVIIPNHIHVPEAVRTGLSFGSFDPTVVINLTHGNNSKSEKCSEHTSESYQIVEDSVIEQAISNDNVVAPPEEEEDSIDHPHSSTHVPENVSSSDADVPSSSVLGFDNSKDTSDVPQHPLVHTSPAYSFAVVPTPVQGNITPSDNSDTQAHDASGVPNFVVQQPIDPANASIYAQFYQSGVGDGRISPFPLPGVSTRYNGNVTMFPAQTSESPQEGGNPMTLSTTGQAPLGNQAGVMPSTIAVTQQAVPVFRQPPTLPMPHYPPNYFPYGHYISPFYVPPPAIHQGLSNNAFLQHAQAGSVYPGPSTGAASLPQFRRGSSSGNPAHMGISGSYGPYGASPAGYNAGSAAAAAAGNSPTNEDLAGSQYSAGQQTEGSAVWVAAPGRDISGLQTNSFYNLPPQGQHVTFTPSLGGHGSFASVYHPAQAVTAATVHPLLQQSQATPGAVDMVGAAPGSVYQQPQHATQMNWPNNY